MSRPLVGITSHLEPARWADWVRDAAVVATSFPREVDRAGGIPVVLPPVHPRTVGDLVSRFDAFVFTTGAGVADASTDDDTVDTDPRRDQFETALIRAVLDAGRPFLAIERGLQILNAATGGTLLPAHGPTLRLVDTEVTVSISSGLGKVLGDHARVRRGQGPAGVKRIGSGLQPVAWDTDQEVAALEATGHPFGIGVRWRPEETDDHRLFQALVDQAAV